MIEIKNEEGFEYLSTIKNNSIDLILTDPPYITSTESGMNTLYKKVKENEEKGIEFIKTEEEWQRVKSRYIEKDIPESVMKSNYMHYGNIYGKKYAVKTDYGD
jgi:DNA modification methylase